MTTSSPELSSASPSDLPEVLALLRRCELPETGVAEAIADFLVARPSGELLGCAGLEVYGDWGLLRSVAVKANVRERGLGRALVCGVSALARRRHVQELYLLTTTAHHFFARLGYVALPRASVPTAIAESWEFRVGCPHTALAMRLALGDSS